MIILANISIGIRNIRVARTIVEDKALAGKVEQK